ncbi:MAG TPA: EamA family transporter [Candidatus Peribacterales bacterium]|nr:EamA family transporter [Candidatus Peribacterales bacterium]
MWLVFTLISMVMWALVNVIDSLIVRNYEKNPFVLMWCQSFFSIFILILFPLLTDIHTTPWMYPLLLVGCISFIGDLWFFRIINVIDISVTNAAWAILSLLLSVVGFLLFQESWTALQSLGAILIIAGAFMLSFFNHSGNLRRTVLYLTSLALLYLPFYVVEKAALESGLTVTNVFFWILLARELLAFSIPLSIPSIRSKCFLALRSRWSFSLFNAAAITCFFLAEFLGAWAYSTGYLSLVSIVSNMKPVVVISLAWLLTRFSPNFAPRELLTAQSVHIKLLSFSILFVGLALLVVE